MVLSTFIIAEAGVNHNGSLDLAKALIDAASQAGADAVKFQSFKADLLVTRSAGKAVYQTKTTSECESQYDMLSRLELDEAAHHELHAYSARRGIQFLSTPFDLESAIFLAVSLDLPRLKLSSGDLTNAPLLLACAQTGKPLILSTGMSCLTEIEAALGVLAFGYLASHSSPSREAFAVAYASDEGQRLLRDKVVLLHCTTEYPAPIDEVNLRAMDTLRHAFGLPVGYSDHTEGIAIPVAAAARGASIVEKHFTLDRTLPGPDHKASLEPSELTEMVKAIRQVDRALGNGLKVPSASERKNMEVARKSLVAAVDMAKGGIFSEENLTVKRPGNGLAPIHYWDYLGKPANRDYRRDEAIDP